MPASKAVANLAGTGAKGAAVLWVDLSMPSPCPLHQAVPHGLTVHLIRQAADIDAAMRACQPRFMCFEWDDPAPASLCALAQVRRDHPATPVLLITGCSSVAMAIWALRIRVWDLLVKPVISKELELRIAALAEMTRASSTDAHHACPASCQLREGALQASHLGPPPGSYSLPAVHIGRTLSRTHAAIAHVERNLAQKIGLDDVAGLCRLSPSQFCRVFRQEHGISFSQYVLRYRIDKACEGLTDPGALAKEVAYSVGFNDLSYFTWAFKRQLGVCPSVYQASAKQS